MKKSGKLLQTLIKNSVKGENVRTQNIVKLEQEVKVPKVRSKVNIGQENILPFSYFLTDSLGRQHDYLRHF